MLDFSALEPGRAATETIAQTVRDLKLAGDYQARVSLTGIVPINDDGFATLKQNAALNIAVSVLAVLFILWLALHSLRIIFAVVISLIVGLMVTAAAGLMLVGALNLISVAFFVLFIGLGVDFGLQFCVRYRAERHDYGDLRAGSEAPQERPVFLWPWLRLRPRSVSRPSCPRPTGVWPSLVRSPVAA